MSPASTVPGAYVDVAFAIPVDQSFTYSVPADTACPVGARVAVRFHGRKLTGFVVAERAEPPPGIAVKPLVRVLDTTPTFTPELLAFVREAARYYLTPYGEALRVAAPAMPSRTVTALRDQGFLEKGESLSVRTVARPERAFVRRVQGVQPGRLGPRMAALLARLPEDGTEVPRDELGDASIREPLARLVTLGLVTVERRREQDPFFSHAVPRDEPKSPTPDQANATAAIVDALSDGRAEAFLLHGVTGSGKTEVYLAAIARALAAGRSALLLVPEIGLTPQLVDRLRARFGDDIAVLHSALSPRRRMDAWEGLRSGRLRVAVGARSALFAPMESLGLVIVDEEHDPSYKQEEGFRYHARDMALLRAARAGAVCVLGSATPSMEAYELSERGRVERLVLRWRPAGVAMPTVEVVDLKRQRKGPHGPRWLSAPMVKGIETCLAKGEQAILFLNRRGFAPSLRCDACGDAVTCPACDLSLTEHLRAGRMRCHTCDFSRDIPDACPSCGVAALERVGAGTEAVEKLLAEVFPKARIGRLDRDAASEDGAFTALEAMRRGELDLLVGTQMVTKGHDLPGVTFVGVLLADQALSFPDFRAAERTYQLVSQVAGRAGRADRPGRVVIQTFSPEVPAIAHATRHDYPAFFEAERADREAHGMPPCGRLAAVRVDAGDEQVASQTIDRLAALVRAHPACVGGHVTLLGPAPAPIARARGRHRYRMLLRSADRKPLRAVLDHLRRVIDEGVEPARASLDVDPVSML